MPKRESRAARQARLLAEATRIDVPPTCDVCVVGGGAAGLAAAIVAAEAGASVVVLERESTCGRTILATGNGRCNFANVGLDPKRYNDPAFVAAVTGDAWLNDVLAFFRESGMRWCLEHERLYPLSRQATSVRNVLLARARRAGVVLAPARTVEGIREGAVSFSEGWGSGTTRKIKASAVVVATGGGSLSGLDDLGLKQSPVTPVLCPLACEDSPLAELDGRRAHVRASLTKRIIPTCAEIGEVLFRSYGLSGIVIFDLSREAAPGDLIELDLVPDLTVSELRQIVDPFARGTLESGILDGIIDPQIAQVIERLARQRWQLPELDRPLPATDAETAMAFVKALPFRVLGPAAQEQAQVTRGGLATHQFDPATLACTARPWLHACGEALDIDGACGGFNLAWAWKSGMVAGTAAARRA